MSAQSSRSTTPPFDSTSLEEVGDALRTSEFQTAILTWFEREGRKDLPWQEEPTPYRIWVSETMLQQTQVGTVIPYFLRFMDRFPHLQDLAEASQDEVLQCWAGLGYYARARNLHRTARVIQLTHGGKFPQDCAQLCALPGIGRSTAGAILSLAFDIPAPILDGNVKRVLSRLQAIESWPGETEIVRQLWQLSEQLTPQMRVDEYTQAIMDLGATVCTPRHPACSRCPVQAGCRAFHLGRVGVIPAPRPRRALTVRRCLVLALRNQDGAFFLQKRPPAGVWGGLWSFPEFDTETELAVWCERFGIDGTRLEHRSERRHTFTHFHLVYRPIVARTGRSLRIEENNCSCWSPADVDIAVPAPIRRLMNELDIAARTSSADHQPP